MNVCVNYGMKAWPQHALACISLLSHKNTAALSICFSNTLKCLTYRIHRSSKMWPLTQRNTGQVEGAGQEQKAWRWSEWEISEGISGASLGEAQITLKIHECLDFAPLLLTSHLFNVLQQKTDEVAEELSLIAVRNPPQHTPPSFFHCLATTFSDYNPPPTQW